MKRKHIRSRVESKLSFAERRAADIEGLNDGDFAGADPQERQQLVQEFFFHLIGAIELVAQGLNVALDMGFDPSSVTAQGVISKLPEDEEVRSEFSQLYSNVRKEDPPNDLTSEAGLAYRMWAYRHHVTHRWQKPFRFRVGSAEPPASYLLDPLRPKAGASTLSVFDDNRRMLGLVESRLQEVLKLVGL